MTLDLESRALEVLGELVGAAESERAAVLDRYCHDNLELRLAVDEMWRDYSVANRQGFLKAAAWELIETPASCPTPPPKKLGRFEFLKSLGEGSQGEVWLAYDPELRREVALKIVPQRLHGAERVLAKFRREAEITARLEHPNIVPVYEGGRDDHDIPFYAMRVLRSDHLHHAIDRWHQAGWSETGLRDLLARFLDICDAVAYAHQQGIIHRDLKPQNVMLGQFGETLVADWGIAKVVGQPEVVGVGTEADQIDEHVAEPFATRVGDVFGTVEYMSPEQAAGRTAEIGFESDQYSLGAILYCILTGHAPIDADTKPSHSVMPKSAPSQQPANSTIAHLVVETQPNQAPPNQPRWQRRLPLRELLDRVIRGEYPKPRQLVAHVPIAVEAICLKAMSVSRSGRYSSVVELAKDVKRWLNDEPVRVCREPLRDRLRRWVKRHRAASAALAMTVVGLVAFSVMQWQHLTKLRAQKMVAAHEASERQHALVIAVESLESQTELVRHEELLRQPQMLAFRLRLLQQALTAFERWATTEVNSRELVLRVATQLLQVAETVEETVPELQLLQQGVDRETSESAVKQAQNLLSRFLESHRDDTELQLFLASAGRTRADILLNRGDETQSERQYVTSLAVCDQLLSRQSSLSQDETAKIVIERSRIIRGSGRMLFDRAMSVSHPDECSRHLTAILEMLAPLKQSLEPWQTNDVASGLEFAKVLNAIATSMHKGGKLSDKARRAGKFVPPSLGLSQLEYSAEVIEIFQQAITVCGAVRARLRNPDDFPAERVALDRLEAQILNNMTLSIRANALDKSDWATPLALHERSRALRQAVLDRHPWLLEVRMELAQSLGNIADTLSDSPDSAREIEARRSAIEVLRAAISESPSAIGIRQFWALHMIRLMAACRRSQDDDQAARVFEETIRLHATPEDAEPANAGHLFDTAVGWVLLARSDDRQRAEALDRAEALVLRCDAVRGLGASLVTKLRQDPVLATLRERPAIQELIRRLGTKVKESDR